MENQAIAQRPNERDIQKRFNSRNAISSSILIVIGVFMVSLTLTMHTQTAISFRSSSWCVEEVWPFMA